MAAARGRCHTEMIRRHDGALPAPFKVIAMAILLEVPFVTQLDIGGHVPGNTNTLNDYTGCWYASACMVGYYFAQGPRHGVPELFTKQNANPDGSTSTGHWAIPAGWMPTLMQREGLVAVADHATKVFTLDEIEALLKARGPLMFSWMKTHGGATYGHVSVVIGTDATGIVFHDPEKAPKSTMTIGNFDAKRYKYPAYPYYLLYSNMSGL